MPHDVAERLAFVRARVAAACARVGRAPESVTLLAVSKQQPAALVREALAAGQRAFGESYAQELEQKAHELTSEGAAFHFIGQLQRNKVARVLEHAALVHTVDRASLAHELARRQREGARRVPVLLEVNLGGETSKAGVAPSELPALHRSCVELGLMVRGLMTIPPPCERPDDARPFFVALRRLRDELGGVEALPELSMGMSGDFEVAIEEGATLVRVGTAIFGERG